MVRPCVARGFHRDGGERSCINVSGLYWSALWAPGHHGYQRACDLISGQASTGPLGSPVFARAGKTDPPSRLILSQTSAGKRCLAYVIGSSSSRAVPLFVPCGRSFVPARACAETPRARVVKAGRRAYLASRSGAARPRLDGPEHGATLTPVGTPSCPCCCIRSCAPC